MDASYHYPPELLELLVETIPRLHRSKKALLIFFRGAGVPESVVADLHRELAMDRDSIRMFPLVRTVLTRLNDAGDQRLRERREIIRRVTEWDDFSTCWPDWRMEAEGLVSKVRELVGRKDSFTRMRQERDKERQARIAEKEAEARELRRRAEELEVLKNELYSLFSSKDPHERGARFESTLNQLFRHFDILIQESFTRTGENGEGVIEQVDGVVNLNGRVSLVEVKWQQEKVNREQASSHLSRVFLREASQGLIISTSGFTSGADTLLKEALPKATVAKCTLPEIVQILERGEDLKTFLTQCIDETVTRR